MQYAKQQIFLSQIQHLNIFACVNKKKKGLISSIMQISICYYQSPSQKKEINKSKEHSTKSITLADSIQKLYEKNMKLEILIVKAIVK